MTDYFLNNVTDEIENLDVYPGVEIWVASPEFC